MKTIPQIRVELLEFAKSENESGRNSNYRKLRAVVRNLYRRPNVRKAAKESAKFTPDLALRIRTWAIANPAWSYIKIGKKFNVSIGRVSEAIAGKRVA